MNPTLRPIHGVNADPLQSKTQCVPFKYSGDSETEKINEEPSSRKSPAAFFKRHAAFHIVLAEDDREMRSLLAGALRGHGYEVTECSNGWTLLGILRSFLHGHLREEVNLIISDIRMPGFSALDALRCIPRADGFPPIILITAFGDEKTHAQAEAFGVAALFDKPFEVDDLLSKVHELLPSLPLETVPEIPGPCLKTFAETPCAVPTKRAEEGERRHIRSKTVERI